MFTAKHIFLEQIDHLEIFDIRNISQIYEDLLNLTYKYPDYTDFLVVVEPDCDKNGVPIGDSEFWLTGVLRNE